MKEKVILWHEDGLRGNRAFDVFVREGSTLDEFEKDFIESLYEVDCRFVQKFLAKFPNYRYMGSEDLLHADFINRRMEKALRILYEKGWQRMEVGGET